MTQLRECPNLASFAGGAGSPCPEQLKIESRHTDKHKILTTADQRGLKIDHQALPSGLKTSPESRACEFRFTDRNLMHNSSDASRHTSEIRRRSFLTATAAAGLAASSPLRNATAAMSGPTPRQKIVKVILQGGPSQIDLWDPKPTAGSEGRGPFDFIRTRIPGIQVSECLPQIADTMHHFTIVRSVTGSIGSHRLVQATTGFATPEMTSSVSRPVPATSFANVKAMLESGASDIVLNFGQWDHHCNLKSAIESQAYALDTELTRFIRSLLKSGLLESTIVLVWGEFGRSPRPNAMGGRDHWPAVNSALIAGGAHDRGNVWGATSDDGSYIVDGAVSMSEVLHNCVHDVAVFS